MLIAKMFEFVGNQFWLTVFYRPNEFFTGYDLIRGQQIMMSNCFSITE